MNAHQDNTPVSHHFPSVVAGVCPPRTVALAAFISATLLMTAACSDEPEEVTEKDAAAIVDAAPIDLGTTPEMDTPPERLLNVLPRIPKGISGAPGTPVTELLKDPNIKKDAQSSRILKKKMADGPFSDVRYLLMTQRPKSLPFMHVLIVRIRSENETRSYLNTRKKLGEGTSFDNTFFLAIDGRELSTRLNSGKKRIWDGSSLFLMHGAPSTRSGQPRLGRPTPPKNRGPESTHPQRPLKPHPLW